MTTLAADIRRVLNTHGPITSAALREQLEDDTVSTKQLATSLASLERSNHITVDRENVPFQYSITTTGAAFDDQNEYTEQPAPKRAAKTPTPKAKKKTPARKPHRTPAAAAPPRKPATRRTQQNTGTTAYTADDVRRLCVLAISPTDNLTHADRALIARCMCAATA